MATIPEPETDRGAGPDGEELSRVVHEELDRLPERLRAPLVLCYLEGMTHEQAASQLGCPVGTVRSRLARARDRLRGRMARRGLATSSAAIAVLLAADGRASAISPQLSGSLVKIAARVAVGTASLRGGCGASARVAALLEGVLNVSRAKQIVGSMAALAAVGVVATVAALSVFSASGQTGGGPDLRPLGPDGRPIGTRIVPTLPDDSYVKTYYIGDLLLSGRAIPVDTRGIAQARQMPDMSPVIDLITSTVARGTWTVHDVNGQEVTPPDASEKWGPIGRRRTTVGRITPFYLSLSLIVRHTKEGHEEVADVLRKLRNLVYARDNSPGGQGQEPAAPNQSPSDSRKYDKRSTAPTSDRNDRIRRLLDELRQEVEKLPEGGS